MSTARVASNHSSPASPSCSLNSNMGASTKALAPLNVASIDSAAILNGMPNTNGCQGVSPNGTSPNTHTFSNAQATYTREEVLHCIQSTIVAVQRDYAARAQAQARRGASPEAQIMKPRVHLFEHHPHPSSQAQTCTLRKVVATLELPGLTKSDIAITARPNGELLVSGERKPLHLQPTYLQYLSSSHGLESAQKNEELGLTGRTVFNELKFGRFQRVLRLPEGTDVSLCHPFLCSLTRSSH